MAKAKRYFYKCVYPCDVGYWGPDQRKERWGKQGQPPKVLHSVRVLPSRGYDSRGRERPGDYIVTDKPLAKHFTQETVKKVSRPSWDPQTGRRNGRVYRKKVTKVKFELLDADEIDREIREAAYDKPWCESLFEEAPEKVDLPADVAIMDKSVPLGEGDEPVEMVDSDEEPVRLGKQ